MAKSFHMENMGDMGEALPTLPMFSKVMALGSNAA
jgi:hypothetical protein